MTKSTITREQLLEIIETDHVQCGEASYLARMALAAMDSEPVAEVVSIYGDPEAFGEREIRPLVGIQQMPYGTKLYRHAQPDASHLSRICAESYQVVGALAEALRIFNDVGVIKSLDNLSAQEIIHDDVLPFSVPEAAQQPVLLDGLIKAVEFYEQVKRENPPVETGAWKDAVDWVLKEACRAAMLQAGNSPAIPDGYVMVPKEPTEEMLQASYREASVYSPTAYRAMIAAALQEVKP